MTQQAMQRNPFMLMISPEVVLAAVAKSERLSQLNRHLCRPLDRPTAGAGGDAAEGVDGGEEAVEESEGGGAGR